MMLMVYSGAPERGWEGFAGSRLVQRVVMAAAVMVMPRSRSWAIQSVTAVPS